LNKPWDQAELRTAISDAVETARNRRASRQNIAPIWQDEKVGPQFSIASQLLTIDGCDSDRQEVVEMFTFDYRVHGVSSIRDAVTILSQEHIGVIVTNSIVDGVDVTDMLSEIARIDPAITIVVTTSAPQSDTIIKLINSSKIYRFAIKPLSPNLFRLAVHAAMREHHRRLADPRVVRVRMQRDADREPGSVVYDSFVKSLGRFTQVS
jgi:DNA-binding NtrC family response regulator